MAFEDLIDDFESSVREKFKKRREFLESEAGTAHARYEKALKFVDERREKIFDTIEEIVKEERHLWTSRDEETREVRILLDIANDKVKELLDWLDYYSSDFEEKVDSLKRSWKEQRDDLYSSQNLQKFISDKIKTIDPSQLTPQDMKILSAMLDPYRPKKQGRRGQNMRLVASYWASMYILEYLERKSSFGLVGVVDDLVAEMVPHDPHFERPGEPIGMSSVVRAKKRFRPYIDRVIANPEQWGKAWIEPLPEDDLEATEG